MGSCWWEHEGTVLSMLSCPRAGSYTRTGLGWNHQRTFLSGLHLPTRTPLRKGPSPSKTVLPTEDQALQAQTCSCRFRCRPFQDRLQRHGPPKPSAPQMPSVHTQTKGILLPGGCSPSDRASQSPSIHLPWLSGENAF